VPALERILFPVDFSERCAQTAPYVARIAHKFHSRVFLLHAAEPIPMLCSAPETPTTTITEYQKAMDDENRKNLDRFGREVFTNLLVTRILAAGEPARVITDCAAENKVDLIVLPTHGRGRFRRFLLGSVTSKVLHDTNWAVLTTAHSENLVAPAGDLQTIVCAVDLGPENLHVIADASELARAYGAAVRLVHAIPAQQPTPEFPIDPTLTEALAEDARQRILALQHQCGTSWDVCVQTGGVAQVVRQAVAAHGAALVVIGRGKVHRHFGRLRTHVSSIIRESPCPVLSLPERI
jgi:nucleotide-binding universal stress UspA family protein